MPSIAEVILYSSIAAVATGLGVIPLLFLKNVPKRWLCLSSALASGLLLAAAFDLIGEGTRTNATLTVTGVVVGLLLIIISRKWLDKRGAPEVGALAGADARKAIIIVGIMTIHSFAEGAALGLSFGESRSFGFLISLVIALHNIPEGLAIGLILVPKGVKLWKAGFWSIFSSLPQPLMAVPAFLLVMLLKPFLPFGLGLASGAMIWMIGAEVLPDACSVTSPKSIGAALTVGVVLMLAFQILLG
ncbi:MAG: ZIP family metal transporter [Verrucomicrobia bacterium]|nr:ZIP family metal transporter [Verrucomicrobiota bacterium]MDE3100456.1 ZIP family metal transporter [Verrucomicrobiota bacterium]